MPTSPPSFPTFSPRMRWPMLGLACLLLAGCQLWPFEREDGAPATSASGGAGDEQLVTTDSIGLALTLLQDGAEERAEEMLEVLLADDPGDATARLLLAQIRQPPEDLLGESFEVIEIEAGDSLSAIAGRTIDNELLFYSLARLNDIDTPRLLRPGQRIRVPSKQSAQPQDAGEEAPERSEQAPETEPEDSGELGKTAARLIERERYNQAYALLLSTARAGNLRDADRALLARSSVALARAACREGDPQRAQKMLDQALPWLGAEAEAGEFVRQRDHVDARLALGEAERALARGEHANAFDALLIARELDKGLRETHRQRLERLETVLGEFYHDNALTAWRDQRVDRAVELWERVVRIRPGFEPAIRYLERARRAQRKLRSLEEG